PPVYLITPQMEQVLRQGWTAWSPRQPLPGLDWWTGTGRVGTQMKQSIRERLANDLVSLPGRYLWFTNGAFESELKRVALEALHLRLDHFRSGRSRWLKARRELEPALVALCLRAVTPGADAAATALELCR